MPIDRSLRHGLAARGAGRRGGGQEAQLACSSRTTDLHIRTQCVTSRVGPNGGFPPFTARRADVHVRFREMSRHSRATAMVKVFGRRPARIEGEG